MRKTIVVAKSDNNVIGKDNNLPWHLPADLVFFYQNIQNAFLLTGRISYESAQGSLVFNQNRAFAVLTRKTGYAIPFGSVVNSLEEGFRLAEKSGLQKVCILGGAAIYEESMPWVDEIISTEVHESFSGDTFFPKIDTSIWQEVSRHRFPADQKNIYAYSFVKWHNVFYK